jgi:hypothetical protein
MTDGEPGETGPFATNHSWHKVPVFCISRHERNSSGSLVEHVLAPTALVGSRGRGTGARGRPGRVRDTVRFEWTRRWHRWAGCIQQRAGHRLRLRGGRRPRREDVVVGRHPGAGRHARATGLSNRLRPNRSIVGSGLLGAGRSRRRWPDETSTGDRRVVATAGWGARPGSSDSGRCARDGAAQ